MLSKHERILKLFYLREDNNKPVLDEQQQDTVKEAITNNNVFQIIYYEQKIR
ncbi:hypothetical protein [Natronospora cellulosivora (SeqCode)]